MMKTSARRLVAGSCALLCAVSSPALAEDAPPQVEQADLNALVAAGDMATAFHEAFEAGDELTEHSFDAASGVGANIGEGRRFTRIPRADLTGPGEWATHFPKREGGANATSCIACHNAPIANGAGDVAMNVVLDPDHTGDPAQYIERNTLPLFAMAIPQRLAEEMSLELYLQRDAGRVLACADGASRVELTAKGVSFGTLEMTRTTANPCAVSTDANGLTGIDEDLVVRPFGWKGNEATIRSFTRNAAHNELGLQGVELVGEMDGDFDGVTAELTVGDLTALTTYMAALERPTSLIELAALGQIDLLQDAAFTIERGEALFGQADCTSCHVPSMAMNDPTFREPSMVPGYYDVDFPDGSDPEGHGVHSDTAIVFDMLLDPPNNRIHDATGAEYNLGAIEAGADGTAVARWYSDFRRHDMGPGLADPGDPLGYGASVFLTRSLAGVGSTGPWLHDGRATTLEEAILAHGGEAQMSRDAFANMSEVDRAGIVAFLSNLVIHQADDTH